MKYGQFPHLRLRHLAAHDADRTGGAAAHAAGPGQQQALLLRLPKNIPVLRYLHLHNLPGRQYMRTGGANKYADHCQHGFAAARMGLWLHGLCHMLQALASQRQPPYLVCMMVVNLDGVAGHRACRRPLTRPEACQATLVHIPPSLQHSARKFHAVIRKTDRTGAAVCGGQVDVKEKRPGNGASKLEAPETVESCRGQSGAPRRVAGTVSHAKQLLRRCE